MIENSKMTPLTIALIAFLGGAGVTGGAVIAYNKSQQEQQDIDKVIKSLETQFEKAQASVAVSLTETDLLKIPCSTEYINGTKDKNGNQLTTANGDLLCKEMFCRMNRQGGGQGSNGGAGATAQECQAISDTSLNVLKINTCFQYWKDGAGADQNSQYSQCINQFQKKN